MIPPDISAASASPVSAPALSALAVSASAVSTAAVPASDALTPAIKSAPAGNVLDYPLPVLAVEPDRLTFLAKGRCEGAFTVRNTGGSTLAGHILCHAPSLSFEPSEWRGNETRVVCRFDPTPADGWRPGDVLETCVIISSNGGEKKLPVTVRMTQVALATPEGGVISGLDDFYRYAQSHPTQARRLFADSEFYMLLLATGYEYLEVYEMLHRDVNRERAMDNFFILSGYKPKTGLFIPNRTVEFIREPADDTMVYGNFIVQKTDGGFLEAPLRTRAGAAWLNLSSDRLITSDFNEAHAAMVKFSIDPLMIKGRYAGETVTVGEADDVSPGSANAVTVVFKRLAPLQARLTRDAYAFEDSGAVVVTNRTGVQLAVEAFCDEPFVRFDARRFLVDKQAQIPFTVKPSPFLAAQLLFRRTPFLRAVIELHAQARGTPVRLRLPLVSGEF